MAFRARATAKSGNFRVPNLPPPNAKLGRRAGWTTRTQVSGGMSGLGRLVSSRTRAPILVSPPLVLPGQRDAKYVASRMQEPGCGFRLKTLCFFSEEPGSAPNPPERVVFEYSRGSGGIDQPPSVLKAALGQRPYHKTDFPRVSVTAVADARPKSPPASSLPLAHNPRLGLWPRHSSAAIQPAVHNALDVSAGPSRAPPVQSEQTKAAVCLVWSHTTLL